MHRVAAVVLVLAGLLQSPASHALPSSDSPTTDTTAAAETTAADTLPAPRFEPPPRDYLAEMRAEFGPEDRAYWRTKTALRLLEPLAALVISLLILFSGLAAKMRDIAAHFGRSRWVQLLVMLTLYAVVAGALALPMLWYDTFALEHQYGLSNQTFLEWATDQGKSLMVTLAAFGVVPVLWLVYTVIAHGRRWWLWLGLATLPLTVAATLLEPMIVDPLFNRFSRLEDSALETRIVQLAERAGIPARKVYQVNKSAQTRKLNAYVNGFGVSQRIVLWDTTLQEMEPDEILFVMGHEIGHYALHHIWKGIVLSSAASLVVFWLVAVIAGFGVRRFGRSWGFERLEDPASLPLLAAALTLVLLLAQPALNGVSRAIETEADVYGLEITRDNDAAARAFMKLGAQNRSNPDPPPWIRFALYSHPTLSERVRLGLGYRPWQDGRPNRYYRPRASAPGAAVSAGRNPWRARMAWPAGDRTRETNGAASGEAGPRSSAIG